MKKQNFFILEVAHMMNRLVNPLFEPVKLIKGIHHYFWFFKDLIKYKLSKNSEKIKLINFYPILNEKSNTSQIDFHYFYQGIWAFKKIKDKNVKQHVDVASRVDYVVFLSAITKVTFIDIRPLGANLDNLESKKGTILDMPYEDESINSLSCLHVAEHIGLGRYGDPIDPEGTKKACYELKRILAKDGDLYFSLPVGKPRLCFNAHRIHSPNQIIEYFDGLKLIELSGIDDNGKFIRNIDIETLENSDYACGLFHFLK